MSDFTDPETVPPYIAAEADAGKCQGSCAKHDGAVRPAFVVGWGWFPYCEVAVNEDRQRGLTVKDPTHD